MPWEHTGCQKGAASPPDGRQDTSETAQFHWFGLAIALCHEGQGDFSIVRLDGTKDGHGMDGWMALWCIFWSFLWSKIYLRSGAPDVPTMDSYAEPGGSHQIELQGHHQPQRSARIQIPVKVAHLRSVHHTECPFRGSCNNHANKWG